MATLKVRHSEKEKPHALEKSLTGIAGFDQITNGGLPKGRPTIVCGGPGCGKTMFAMEFLVRGATEFNEPGVLMTFEETGDEMTKNVASLGFDLKALAARKKIMMDYVKIEPAEIQETGAYDLEGLFVRLQYAVDKIGAKRVVLDTLEAIFSGFANSGMLRAEIRRLFRWLKDRGLTTVVTAERGDGSLTLLQQLQHVALGACAGVPELKTGGESGGDARCQSTTGSALRLRDPRGDESAGRAPGAQEQIDGLACAAVPAFDQHRRRSEREPGVRLN